MVIFLIAYRCGAPGVAVANGSQRLEPTPPLSASKSILNLISFIVFHRDIIINGKDGDYHQVRGWAPNSANEGPHLRYLYEQLP